MVTKDRIKDLKDAISDFKNILKHKDLSRDLKLYYESLLEDTEKELRFYEKGYSK